MSDWNPPYWMQSVADEVTPKIMAMGLDAKFKGSVNNTVLDALLRMATAMKLTAFTHPTQKPDQKEGES